MDCMSSKSMNKSRQIFHQKTSIENTEAGNTSGDTFFLSSENLEEFVNEIDAANESLSSPTSPSSKKMAFDNLKKAGE